MIINIFEKQLKQIAETNIMLDATPDVGNNAMSLRNTCNIRQGRILEPNRISVITSGFWHQIHYLFLCVYKIFPLA